MDVWFVDDREENRAAWFASFPLAVKEACALRAFASVPEFIAALDADVRPDVIFVDFFIRGHYGLEVLERLQALDGVGPLIIAHSSMPEANAGMIREGAHFALAKIKGVASTASIEEAFQTPEDLRRAMREHLS
jgi:CheY-like chemotaxis protein